MGSLTGSCIIRDYEYAKASQIEELKNSKQEVFINKYETSHDGVKVTNFEYDYQDKDSLPLLERFILGREADNNGGFALFNYNLFTGLTKNPFASDVRFTNINFGYPYTIEVEQTIELPGNAKTENLLRDRKVEEFNGRIALSRSVKRVGNLLKIKILFTQTISTLEADSYPKLKNIYKSMVDMLNEPVVIKL